MILLHQFGPVWAKTSPSPACAKVETYLRMAGLEFKTVSTMDSRKAPKGKLPFITDEGQKIADSTFIIEYLKEQYGDPLDIGLNDKDKAISLAFQRMIEENLYWCVIHARWQDAHNWPKLKKALFSRMPFPLRVIIPPVARKMAIGALKGQGMGRHSLAEVSQIAIRDIAAIATFLGDKAFIMGDKPSSLDATVYAFISTMTGDPVQSEFKDFALKQKNLVDYCERMTATYYEK